MAQPCTCTAAIAGNQVAGRGQLNVKGGAPLKHIAFAVAASMALALAPVQPTLALSCSAGNVVWIEAYNSADGTYKKVSWQGGSRYFSGSGTDYVNTNRQSNGYLTITSNSSTKSASEFCVPIGVEFG